MFMFGRYGIITAFHLWIAQFEFHFSDMYVQGLGKGPA